MATTTHDEGFHEIQLNGKQLVFLFMAGTVVAVVIFLLGVFVGRGVRAQIGEVDPLVAEAQEGATATPTPVPEPPPVASTTGSGAPASASEDLSYPKRLAGEPPKEGLQNPPPAAARPQEVPAPARAQAPAAPAISVPTEPAGDGFAIQLAALAKREEAEVIVRRLSDKGYKAYLIPPAAGTPPVYRVRVGKFKDRREAESTSARLQKEEQFKPWIVR